MMYYSKYGKNFHEMTYDHEEYKRIEAMPLDELIHYMITHYKDYTKGKEFADLYSSYIQNDKYNHVLEYLIQIGKKLNAQA